jgi:putative membrane protein
MQIHRKLLSPAIAVLALVASVPLRAQNLNAQDQKFIQTAAKGGMMEVHMGRLGAERGASPGVKSFSQMLISDHTKGNQELMALAKQKGVTLPSDDAKMVMSMPFANKSGADFDREFAKEAVEDHQKDIGEFEKEANTGADADVRNWAKRTLPTLRAHLASAQALQKP